MNREEESREQPTVDVQPGHKFGVMAIAELRGGVLSRALVNLSGGFAASSVLPYGLLATWQEDIGRFHTAELRESGLFLWALAESKQPGVLDGDNELLSDRAHRLFLGTLIATPYLSTERLTLLSGGNVEGSVGVRSLTTYPRIIYTLGAPSPNLTIGKLKTAASLAEAIERHEDFDGRARITRAVSAFRRAVESWDISERLHQFVRCAEGFAVPPIRKSGAEFAARLSRVCFGRARPYLEEMYLIRSGIEHLHGPVSRMPLSLSHWRMYIRLLERTVQAEAVARYLLSCYFQNPDLWPRFADLQSANSFWNLPPSDFRRLWPSRFALYKVLRVFNYREVENEAEFGKRSRRKTTS